MAGRADCTCVQASRKHPDKAQIREIEKMKHHFGSKPKQFCENGLDPYQDTLSAGGEKGTGERRAGAALMEKKRYNYPKEEIFFRELKFKGKFAKAIKRRMSEDVYTGII